MYSFKKRTFTTTAHNIIRKFFIWNIVKWIKVMCGVCSLSRLHFNENLFDLFLSTSSVWRTIASSKRSMQLDDITVVYCFVKLSANFCSKSIVEKISSEPKLNDLCHKIKHYVWRKKIGNEMLSFHLYLCRWLYVA